MLNRRHLRIKVLQALYAWFQVGDSDYALAEKQLMKSIDRIYDLYLLYLLLFNELQVHAANKIEEALVKKLPRPEDLNPNRKFVDNKILTLLSSNIQLQTEAKNRKLYWNNEQDLIRKIFNDIRNSEQFEKYMNDPGRMFDQDKEFILAAFKEYIANSESLLNHLEESSISWMDDIDMVCSAVLKTIKAVNEGDDATLKLMPLYKDAEEDSNFVKVLFRKTVMNDTITQDLISAKTENWEMERIASMDMLLMKMAINEAKEFSSIPTKVTLNEYIEISKFYSTPKSNGFINGILDKIFIELKSSGEIKKVGRGLIE